MVGLRLASKLVVVVGSGHVSNVRVRSALEADARVRVIAPSITPEVQDLLDHAENLRNQRLTWLCRSVTSLAWLSKPDDACTKTTPLSHADFEDADLLLSTIDNEEISEAIAKACRERKIPVTCADIPNSCDFWMTSVHRDGPLQVAVSSNGSGPKLSALLREMIASAIPTGAGQAIEKVGLLRQIVRSISPEKSASARRMRWLSSLCESMSIERLAALTDSEIASLAAAYASQLPATSVATPSTEFVFPVSPSQCLLLPLRRALSELPSSAQASEALQTRWMVQLCASHSPESIAQALENPQVLAHLVSLFTEGKPASLDSRQLDTSEKTTAAGRTTPTNTASSSTLPSQKQEGPDGQLPGAAVSDRSTSAVVARSSGEVALISCGPGDPDLLTVKAVRYISQADVVLADVLVSMDVLQHARKDAEIYIAEKRDCGQDEGQSRLFQLALEALNNGKRVVRLKGGDAFLFGRGGEEVLFFKKHGYSPIVVPGVSALIAAPAAISVPLTYRHITDQVLVLTAVGSGGAWPSNIPAYSPNRTLVVFMAVNRLKVIAQDHLIARYGYPDTLPAAVVENATLASQRQVFGTLATIGDLAAQEKIQSPATVIIGLTALPDLLKPDELLS